MTNDDVIGSLQDLLRKQVTVIATNVITIQWLGRLEQIVERDGVVTLLVRPPRKRYLDAIPLGRGVLLFDGNAPFQPDGEVPLTTKSGMTVCRSSGNCCINLVGDPDMVNAAIEQRNRNPLFTAKELVVSCALNGAADDWIQTPVWPDVPLTQSHAPLEALRAQTRPGA